MYCAWTVHSSQQRTTVGPLKSAEPTQVLNRTVATPLEEATRVLATDMCTKYYVWTGLYQDISALPRVFEMEGFDCILANTKPLDTSVVVSYCWITECTSCVPTQYTLQCHVLQITGSIRHEMSELVQKLTSRKEQHSSMYELIMPVNCCGTMPKTLTFVTRFKCTMRNLFEHSYKMAQFLESSAVIQATHTAAACSLTKWLFLMPLEWGGRE